jgi:ATP-binding cassette subfamily F protein uup
MSLNIAVFDQNKETLPTDLSLWNFLSGVTELGGSGKNDQIMVHGKPRHIVGYLNDFLFTREQTYGLISDLSGGEKSRLLLAILMAKESNMLVLDEPTNDLDLETLDLLKELISLYEGTVIFVSHDRDFIDSVATHTFLMEEGKTIIVHAGGFSDFRKINPKILRRKEEKLRIQSLKSAVKVPLLNMKSPKNLERKISDLEEKIETLNYEINKLELFLSNEDLYVNDKKKFELVTNELISRQNSLKKAEETWLEYEFLLE